MHIYPVKILSVSPPITALVAQPVTTPECLPTCIFFHGLNSSCNQIFEDRYLPLARYLTDQGMNIISVDLRDHGDRLQTSDSSTLEDIVNHIKHHASDFFEKTFADLTAVVDYCLEKKLAMRGHIGAIGLSWGGMHVLYAMNNEPRIQCGIALLPVCRITALKEFHALQGNSVIEKYDPIQYLDNIAPRPLMLLTAENDSRADPRYAEKVYRYLLPFYEMDNCVERLAYMMYLEQDHLFHQAMISPVIDWIMSYISLDREISL